MNWHHVFHKRVEELGRRIETMRPRVSRHDRPLDLRAIQAFAEIEARHADLHHTVGNLQVRLQGPRREVVDALEADFEGLLQVIDRWIERQDANAQRLQDRTGGSFGRDVPTGVAAERPSRAAAAGAGQEPALSGKAASHACTAATSGSANTAAEDGRSPTRTP